MYVRIDPKDLTVSHQAGSVFWHQDIERAEGIIVAIDSADEGTLARASLELHALLDEPIVAQKPVLVFGTKADCPTAMLPGDFVGALGLQDVSVQRAITVLMCSATNGWNVGEGMGWLLAHI